MDIVIGFNEFLKFEENWSWEVKEVRVLGEIEGINIYNVLDKIFKG